MKLNVICNKHCTENILNKKAELSQRWPRDAPYV